MRLLPSLILGLLDLVATVVAQDDASSLAVELDQRTFKNFVQQNDVVMAECE